MPAPTLHASGAAQSSVVVTVGTTAQNLRAYVAVVREFGGGVAPTINGGTTGRSLLATGSGFGKADLYLFTAIPAGTVTFTATGRVIGVLVFENATTQTDLGANLSGWSTPARPQLMKNVL